MQNGYNILTKPIEQELLNKIINAKIVDNRNKIDYYGKGNAAEKINRIYLNLIK